MEKVYEYENATIHVTSNKCCDLEEFKKVTEEFMKKVISGGMNNGNTNSTRNLNEK